MNLKKESSYGVVIPLIAVIASVISLISFTFGELLVPPAAALCALLFLLERSNKKKLSVAVSLIIIGANLIFVFIPGYGISLCGFEILAISWVIFLCYKRGVSKAESALWVSLIAVAMLLVTLILLAMAQSSDYSFNGVIEFYKGIYESAREDFVAYVDKMNAAIAEQVEGTHPSFVDAGAAFDSVMSLIISIVAIYGFFIAGLTFKLFCGIALKLSDNREKILSWRFSLTNVFAYFYLILVLLSMFMGSADSVFSVAVLNLDYIFTFVFAYVGFGFALSFLTAKRSIGFALLILIPAVVLLSSFAIDLLALFGTFFTISNNRTNRVDQ